MAGLKNLICVLLTVILLVVLFGCLWSWVESSRNAKRHEAIWEKLETPAVCPQCPPAVCNCPPQFDPSFVCPTVPSCPECPAFPDCLCEGSNITVEGTYTECGDNIAAELNCNTHSSYAHEYGWSAPEKCRAGYCDALDDLDRRWHALSEAQKHAALDSLHTPRY